MRVHPRDRTPTPPPMEPGEDLTPLRVAIPDPDHAWFPCQHCGKMNQCPPVARPVNKHTTALRLRRYDTGVIAPELDPDRGTEPTTILNPPLKPPLPDLDIR